MWAGDETTRREFPPLRAAWAKRGQQATVLISGRNARRVIHGMVNVASGEVVRLVRERGRGEDVAIAVQALGERRPEGPKLLVWDNAPPHHTHRARQAAAAARIELAWLPFRSPELNPDEDLWRQLKAVVAANPTGRIPRLMTSPRGRRPGWTGSPPPMSCASLACVRPNSTGYLLRAMRHGDLPILFVSGVAYSLP